MQPRALASRHALEGDDRELRKEEVRDRSIVCFAKNHSTVPVNLSEREGSDFHPVVAQEMEHSFVRGADRDWSGCRKLAERRVGQAIGAEVAGETGCTFRKILRRGRLSSLGLRKVRSTNASRNRDVAPPASSEL